MQVLNDIAEFNHVHMVRSGGTADRIFNGVEFTLCVDKMWIFKLARVAQVAFARDLKCPRPAFGEGSPGDHHMRQLTDKVGVVRLQCNELAKRARSA
jgi:hypothetical protein